MDAPVHRSPSAASVVSSASTSSLPEGVVRSASMEELRALLKAALPERDERAAAEEPRGAQGAAAGGQDEAAGDAAGKPARPAAEGADDDGLAALITAEDMMERAEELEAGGRPRRAALAYLYVVDRFRHSGQPELLGRALSRLADLCGRCERYEEALRFRSAERLVYETRLLALAVAEATAPGAGEVPDEERLRVSARLVGPRGMDMLSEEAVAQAWERVAEMFFEQRNVAMAKQYALRAIRIRRDVGRRKTKSKADEGAKFADQGRAAYEASLRRFQAGAGGAPKAEPKEEEADAAAAKEEPDAAAAKAEPDDAAAAAAAAKAVPEGAPHALATAASVAAALAAAAAASYLYAGTAY